jgi:hypothetical protein
MQYLHLHLHLHRRGKVMHNVLEILYADSYKILTSPTCRQLSNSDIINRLVFFLPMYSLLEYWYILQHETTGSRTLTLCHCHVRAHLRSHRRTRTQTHAYIHTFIHACVHTYIHTCIHIYLLHSIDA